MHSLEESVVAGLREHVRAAAEVPAQPSRSHAAQRAKEALEQDPTNLELLYELGCRYAEAGHWMQSRNVLLRGRGRLDEIHDRRRRAAFASALCEAYYSCGQAKEAVGVLGSIPELEDTALAVSRATLACKVYGAAGDRQRSLKEFCKAVDGQDFDGALRVWSVTRADLRQAGALDAAKGMMERLADDDPALVQKLGALEDLAEELPASDAQAKGPGRLGPILGKLRTLIVTLPLRLERLGLRLAGGRLGSCCARRGAPRAPARRAEHRGE